MSEDGRINCNEDPCHLLKPFLFFIIADQANFWRKMSMVNSVRNICLFTTCLRMGKKCLLKIFFILTQKFLSLSLVSFFMLLRKVLDCIHNLHSYFVRPDTAAYEVCNGLTQLLRSDWLVQDTDNVNVVLFVSTNQGCNARDTGAAYTKGGVNLRTSVIIQETWVSFVCFCLHYDHVKVVLRVNLN